MTKAKSQRYRRDDGRICIDLKLREIAQLFDSRDPAPFLERDLDDNAVDYIVSAALDHPRLPLKLVIHLPEANSQNLQTATIIESIHNHFDYDADLIARKLRHTLRRGQMALVIGIFFLAGCLSLAQWLRLQGDSYLSSVVRESLVILGWVALWRPIDIFLYAWWPELEKKQTYLRLSRVPIEFKFGH